MGHRGWIMPIDTPEQVAALRRWYANVEDDEKTDWSLRFMHAAQRRDRRFLCFNSDGSGVAAVLPRYGYQGEVRLLGDYPDWDRPGSPLGPLAEARYVRLFDPAPHEFVSKELFAPSAEDHNAFVRFDAAARYREIVMFVNEVRQDPAVRMIPRVVGAFCLASKDALCAPFVVIQDVPQAAVTALQERFHGAALAEAPTRKGWHHARLVDVEQLERPGAGVLLYDMTQGRERMVAKVEDAEPPPTEARRARP